MKAYCRQAVRSALAAVLFALLASFIPHSLAAEATLNADTSAPGLVRAAVDAELRGDGAARAKLLKEAVAADPDFAPARWQSGFVRHDKEWLTLEQAAQRNSSDEIRKEYRKQRDALIDTADNHRELARWCRRNKLPDEERVHWAHVLEFEQGDAEAINALGLQMFSGQLMTRKQIDEVKKLAGEQLRATKTWQPKITRWRSAITQGGAKQRDDALAQLRELNDADAIPALETVLAAQTQSKVNDELNNLLIETLGRVNDPRATEALLRRSLLPDSPDVRAAAADQLKKRQLHEFVPQLAAAMPGRIHTQFQIFLHPDGQITHEHQILMEGKDADVKQTETVTLNEFNPWKLQGQLVSAAQIEARAANAQRRLDWQRDRVQFALARATGFTDVGDPELLQKQYDEAYGWYTSPEYKQLYTQERTIPVVNYSLPTTQQTPVKYTPTKPSRPLLRWGVEYATTTKTAGGSITHAVWECFPAGTLIASQNGPVPIESLKIGDRVLSQDLISGELTFQPIQRCTLRAPRTLSRIVVGSESLTTTPGHPLWVAGKGWRTAKQLVPGDMLHTLEGPLKVDEVQEARPTEVYNLVVSDNHNYFVGPHGVLAHDDATLEPTAIPVPGSPAVAAQ